jgi:FMN-dependent NADH-azoreductase
MTMQTLLQLNSSLFSSAGESSRLTDYFVTEWRRRHPDGIVLTRDLACDPVPHLTAERFAALTSKPGERGSEQQAIVDESDLLIDELRRADEIVLGLPFYNYGIPSTLKAYFDHVARAGVTFRYTAQGARGLLTGKRVVVLATRGGVYAGTAHDSQTTYLRDFLGFLGIDDVYFIYAEGLGMSSIDKAGVLAEAELAIQRHLQRESQSFADDAPIALVA